MFSVRAQRPDNILANYKTRFPAFESTLDLDFINNRSVVNGVAGSALALVTFTRSTTGTYFGADGLLKTAAINEPRFEYDPVSFRPLGLLIEESRANLLTYSEQFDNAAWIKGDTTVTANATTAPDGSSNADKLLESATTTQHYIVIPYTDGVGTTLTLSAYFKAAERTFVLLQLSDNATGSANVLVNLSTSSTAVSTGGPFSLPIPTVMAVGNGWYRCTLTTTRTGAGTAWPYISISTGGGPSYAGDGTSGLYIWGAQLEAGAFATSYIPTTTASVTRGADVASMTGANFSSWYNQGEGSVIIDFDSVGSLSSSGRIPLSISDATFNNSIYISASEGNSSVFYVFFGGIEQARISMGAYSNYARRISAIGLQNNNVAAASDGGYAVVDSSCTLPVVDRMYLGSASWSSGSTNSVSGHIRRLTYYPKRLPNHLLQGISA